MYEARLRENLRVVEERVELARQCAGRSDAVRVVAVTKGHPVDAVRAAIAVGARDCGENRVAELADKIDDVGRSAVTWHLIGHLQRNKVRKALPLFDLIHSIDTLRLAQELSREAGAAGLTVRGLVQVNASGEETKGGIDVTDGDVSAAQEAVHQIAELPHLEVHGLMTMAPFVEDEAVLRQTFKRTRRLLEECTKLSALKAHELSMGMSNDFEIAVEEGSTLVRLGTILFGAREP